MTYYFLTAILDEELYKRLPDNIQILYFYTNIPNMIDQDNIRTIDMNEFGIVGENEFTLLREFAFEEYLRKIINEEDIIMLYVTNFFKNDGFLNMTSKTHLLSSFMFNRRYKNFYLYTFPDIFDDDETWNACNQYIEELTEYGNVIPIRILRNFLTRTESSSKKIMVSNVSDAVNNIMKGYAARDMRNVRKKTKVKTKIY